jgi:LysR family transcriptional regulator, glycine cleavage system transcriptional activator
MHQSAGPCCRLVKGNPPGLFYVRLSNELRRKNFGARPGPMPRRLPQLNALKAFEAAARHVSFTRAAEELCVTQGAVSHQVKALETELGIKLFNRERQRLIITDAGRDYLSVVRDALDRIAMGTERLVQRQSSGMLTVSTSPDFAAKWLVHRLGRFAEAHPAIDLRVSATMHHVDFAREDVDLAVRHGDGDWPGLHVTRLCSEQLFAVCSRALGARLKRPKDVLKLPLLHLDDRGPWNAWLEAAGLANSDALHGVVLNRASMLIDAAIDGQGIALARTTLAAWDLIHKRLVRPLPVALPLAKSYWIVCPKATADLPKLVAFRDWLLAQARDDARALRKQNR